MEWFKFNGIDSKNITGLIIKEMPPIVLAKRNIESIKVDGRNGNLHIDNGTYEPVDITIKCIITDMSVIDTLKSYLYGTSNLELSTVPNREYKATVVNQIPFEKYLTLLKEFAIQFELEPFAKSKDESILTIIEDGVFNVGGTVKVNPILEVKGTGTGSITLNNRTINIIDMSEDEAISIDCELMNATQGINSANNKISCDYFPYLINGENAVELINVSEVKIRYKVGWL